jgi:hypothetical protein
LRSDGAEKFQLKDGTSWKGDCSYYRTLEQHDGPADGQKAIRRVAVVTQTGGETAYKLLMYLIPGEGRVVRLSFLTLGTFCEYALPTFAKTAASYHSSPK